MNLFRLTTANFNKYVVMTVPYIGRLRFDGTIYEIPFQKAFDWLKNKNIKYDVLPNHSRIITYGNPLERTSTVLTDTTPLQAVETSRIDIVDLIIAIPSGEDAMMFKLAIAEVEWIKDL